jgi:hypothetical protein
MSLNAITLITLATKLANFHLKKYKTDPRINPLARNASTWKKKDSEKCGLVLSAQKQKDPWYIDNGCSKHMIWRQG